MNLLDFIELGAIGIALVVILIIVKRFLKFAEKQEDNFTEIVKNHLVHDTEAKNKLQQSHNRLAYMIESLIRWLEKNNGK